MQSIILASQSPRRKQLMEWAEIHFEVQVANTDESYPAQLDADEIAIHIARQKALTIQKRMPSRVIVAADTIVVLGKDIIGKPTSREEAIDTLTRLSGNKHRVITGVVIVYPGGEMAFADITEVEFYELTREQIEFYVDKYEPYDKAGAYAIQEWIGVVGIKRVNGDFYNVMGLPVSRVVQALENISNT